MSILSSFLISHLVPALESAFAAHEPEVQAALLKEVETLTVKIGEWMASKVSTPAVSSVSEE